MISSPIPISVVKMLIEQKKKNKNMVNLKKYMKTFGRRNPMRHLLNFFGTNSFSMKTTKKFFWRMYPMTYLFMKVEASNFFRQSFVLTKNLM